MLIHRTTWRMQHVPYLPVGVAFVSSAVAYTGAPPPLAAAASLSSSS